MANLQMQSFISITNIIQRKIKDIVKGQVQLVTPLVTLSLETKDKLLFYLDSCEC